MCTFSTDHVCTVRIKLDVSALATSRVHIWNAANNAIIKNVMENRVSTYSVNRIHLSRIAYIIFSYLVFTTLSYIILYNIAHIRTINYIIVFIILLYSIYTYLGCI